jgi:ABC-type bacteriocin/lantibiotic exporter with double-glycine peptidase domain
MAEAENQQIPPASPSVLPPEILKVRFIKQDSELDCGAAAFEMVYRYHRPSKVTKFDRKKMFAKFRVDDPHAANAPRLNSQTLVDAAVNRGLKGRLCVAPPSVAGMVAMFKGLLYDDKVPIIVCQRLSDEQAVFGHFRVVIGCSDEHVIVHDPRGDNASSWSADQFFDYLKPTGANVTGGVCIVISVSPISTAVSLNQLPWLVMAKKLDQDGAIATATRVNE